MEIIVANEWLERPGGTETYTLTVADHLQRLGHEVTIHAQRLGPIAEHARRQGLRVVAAETDLPAQADAILSQDRVMALELAQRYPAVRQTFVAHSDIGSQLPPAAEEDVVGAVVVLHDRMRRRIEAMALEVEVVRLRQPVDLQRFVPRRPPSSPPRVALVLGNYLRGARRDLLVSALEERDVRWRAIGAHGDGMQHDVADEINEADFVVGKARVIVEAMACGRPAYVYDANGSAGWVTPERYPALEADNFGGQSDATGITAAAVRADLAAYDPHMGLANRDLAVHAHNGAQHAEALVGVMQRLAPGRAAAPAESLPELARLARENLRLEFGYGGRVAEIENLYEGVAERDALIACLTRERDEARGERDAAQAQRDEALSLWRGVEDFRSTRRYRIAQALARPFDAFRST